MSSLVVTKSNPALPRGWLHKGLKLCISLHSLILISVLKAPIGVWSGHPLESFPNGLAVLVEFRAAFLCPLPALATVQTIPRGKLVITFSTF